MDGNILTPTPELLLAAIQRSRALAAQNQHWTVDHLCRGIPQPYPPSPSASGDDIDNHPPACSANDIAPNKPPSVGQQPRAADAHPSVEERSGDPRPMAECNTPDSRRTALSYPEPDTLSSNSTNSFRAQLCSVNRHLDEIQRELIKSKEELGKAPR
ncbi:hypothetical protein BHM03_00025318 [Ensete ventricosum]|nr:hypothetical protein BHM03_00025318 [Ensete ventricosum]